MRTFRGLVAGSLFLEIEHDVLHIIKALIPLVEGLLVHGADACISLSPQICHERAADETACPADADELVFSHEKEDLGNKQKEARLLKSRLGTQAVFPESINH
jgi:hypothetical protein